MEIQYQQGYLRNNISGHISVQEKTWKFLLDDD